MDLPTLFEELNKYVSAFSITSEICSLQQFIEDNGYLLEQLKTQLPEIEQDYTSNTNNTKCTTQIFKKIAQLLNIDLDNNDNLSLTNRKSNNNLVLFTSAKHQSKQISVDIYIPKEYTLLRGLEIISITSKMPISEYLITCYRQFSLDINQHITNNELFKQLQCSNSGSKCIECSAMQHYMDAYETLVHKPFPCINKKMSIGKYNDNINVITQYMIRINTNINRVLFRKTFYPIPLGVFFIAPDAHKQLNLHALGGPEGVQSNNDSRKNTAAIGDVYRLINGQRFIMLIACGNNDDTINATIYVFKPNGHNFTRNKRMSDYVELMYLLNSKPMIVPGFTHDLNAVDCNKAYISYDAYKSCVFKNDIEKDECIKITGCKLNSVKPTYTDLKTEIVTLGISSKKYERTYYKAKTFRRSFATPKYKTQSDGTLNNQLFGIEISWKKGQLITVDELFVLMLVIDYDIVKSALSQCDGQRLNRIFNLRRQLFVILNKYGSSNFGPHNKLYVPATQQITTSGPLVTTSSLTVSEILTSEEGMTIAILPQSKCWKAFDASKLSDYHKQLWLIDFIYLPNIQINKCQVKVSGNESVPICKI